MTKTTSKMNSSSPGAYPGSDAHDRADERAGAGFVLRDTLVDTKVREVSVADSWPNSRRPATRRPEPAALTVFHGFFSGKLPTTPDSGPDGYFR